MLPELSGLSLELGGKWLELIKETIPSAKRVAVFWNRRAEETVSAYGEVSTQWLVLSESIYNGRKWANAGRILVISPSQIGSLETGGRFHRSAGFRWYEPLEDIADFGIKKPHSRYFLAN